MVVYNLYLKSVLNIMQNFDWKTYFLVYPDLKEKLAYTAEDAWDHWVHYGKKEGRVYFNKDEKMHIIQANQTKVKLIFVCHDVDITNKLLQDETKNNFHIFFVGQASVSKDWISNPRITLLRDLPNHIENHKYLLTFTAWYAIIKNNMFLDYHYICILEYDVVLESNFEMELIKNCELDSYDIISFIFTDSWFMQDIREDVMTYFLNKKGLAFEKYDYWFPTTNYCLKRKCLHDFVDWYYPDCLDILNLDPFKISWYHERLFYCFIVKRFYSIYHLNLLSHCQSNSHEYMH
jgi:hypothetical protein